MFDIFGIFGSDDEEETTRREVDYITVQFAESYPEDSGTYHAASLHESGMVNLYGSQEVFVNYELDKSVPREQILSITRHYNDE